jgi:hypothetical protein
MATMNRNVNLEEINSDAFMGIQYLNHQTVLQKAVLIGGIIIAIGFNLLSSFLWHLNINISILLTLLPLIIGIAFGCNYNEDLSLIKYIKLILFKPSITYNSKPTEDLEQLRNSADRIMQAEIKKKQQQASPEEQRKLLIKLLVGAAIAIIFFAILLIVVKNTKTEEVHHTVSTLSYYNMFMLENKI